MACWACVLLWGCAPSQKPYLRRFAGNVVFNPGEDPVARVGRASLVVVEALDGRSKVLGYGTGFVVGDSAVATCLHVVEAASRIRLVLPDGSRHEATGISGSDPLNDLVVVRTAAPIAQGHVLELRSGSARVGETVTALASPRFLSVKATRGEVLAVPEIALGLLEKSIVVSTPASPGFSGGPILDAEGRVLGISSEIRTQGDTSQLVAVAVDSLVPLIQGEVLSVEAWKERTLQPTPAAALLMMRAEGLGRTRPHEALALVEKALSLSPHYARAWSRKADLLMNTGRPGQAEEALRQLETRLPGLESVPIKRCFCLLTANRQSEARSLAEALVAKHPGKFVYPVILAACSWAGRDARGAILASRAAIALKPQDPGLHGICGRFLLGASCLEGAEAEFALARQLDPERALAWHLSGLGAWKRGKADEATGFFRRSLELPGHPAPAVARYLLFSAHWLAGRQEEARSEFQRFLKAGLPPLSQPGTPLAAGIQKAWERLGASGWDRPETHRLIADIATLARNEDLLVPALETCVRLSPEDTELQARLAVQSASLGDYRKAQDHVEKVLARRPNHSAAHSVLGLCRLAAGDPAGGRLELDKALLLNPGNPIALRSLAELELKAGNKESARRLLERAGIRGSTDAVENEGWHFIPDSSNPCL